MIDEAERTYVGHPVKVSITTIVIVVSLWQTKETFFGISTRSGELPHYIERLFVKLWRKIGLVENNTKSEVILLSWNGSPSA